MSYLIHEHSRYTSAVDKYWIFTSKKDALLFWRKMAEGYMDLLDIDFYKEIWEYEYDDEIPFNIDVVKKEILNNEDPAYVHSTEECYLVFTEIHDGFGRAA